MRFIPDTLSPWISPTTLLHYAKHSRGLGRLRNKPLSTITRSSASMFTPVLRWGLCSGPLYGSVRLQCWWSATEAFSDRQGSNAIVTGQLPRSSHSPVPANAKGWSHHLECHREALRGFWSIMVWMRKLSYLVMLHIIKYLQLLLIKCFRTVISALITRARQSLQGGCGGNTVFEQPVSKMHLLRLQCILSPCNAL